MDKNSFKVLGIELSIRLFLVVLAFLATLYMVASNWQWYDSNMDGKVDRPSWSNPVVNWIIMLVWFIITVIVWNLHHRLHKDPVRIDLFYPIILILVFITITLFFEQRDLEAAKWFGVLSVLIMAYILYEGFVTSSIVSLMLIVNFAILLYIVAQMWWFSKNYKNNDPVTTPTTNPMQYPYPCPPEYI